MKVPKHLHGVWACLLAQQTGKMLNPKDGLIQERMTAQAGILNLACERNWSRGHTKPDLDSDELKKR